MGHSRAIIGQLLCNFWAVVGQLLGNFWETFGRRLGNRWATFRSIRVRFAPASFSLRCHIAFVSFAFIAKTSQKITQNITDQSQTPPTHLPNIGSNAFASTVTCGSSAVVACSVGFGTATAFVSTVVSGASTAFASHHQHDVTRRRNSLMTTVLHPKFATISSLQTLVKAIFFMWKFGSFCMRIVSSHRPLCCGIICHIICYYIM